MKIAYTLTEENYLNFNVYHATHSPSHRKLAWCWRTLPLIVCLAVAAAAWIFLAPLEPVIAAALR